MVVEDVGRSGGRSVRRVRRHRSFRPGHGRARADYGIAIGPIHKGDLVPTSAQWAWLKRGMGAPGAKLPLFDRSGREVPRRVVEACVRAGWAEPWFSNPSHPDWLVCRLTSRGEAVVTFLDGLA
jgi:hypothetical protein